MLRTIVIGLGLLALAACSPPQASDSSPGPGEAAAQTASAAPAGAETTITAWYREQLGNQLIEPVSIFFGDFTGDGAPDALAWGDFDTGGSSANHLVALFRNQGGRMVHWRNDETVFGQEPRDVSISHGRITLTTTMPRPGDPHCCPTGEQSWTINAN
ncbi:MAG: hypothetical protein JNJ63_09310 [Hyphomonadaceae bacterium]|nr:hypothetical protein [Hyphomonadaceae bacterium]